MAALTTTTTTTTTSTTTILEMTMTLTPARSAETNRRLVTIARISDDINTTIVSLRHMRQYGNLHGQQSSTLSSVSRMATSLSCIRKNLERIRGYLMDDETIVCAQFNRDLDVCATTGRAFADKLCPIVAASAPPPPPRVRLGNVTVVSAGKEASHDSDSDQESLKGVRRSGDDKRPKREITLSIETEEREGGISGVLSRFQPFADHLSAGLGVLLKASGYKALLDQELLLDSYASREVFGEIKHDGLELATHFNGDHSPSVTARLKSGLYTLGSLLLPAPAKPTTVLKKAQPEQSSEKLARRQSISRSSTWPILKQLDKDERSAAREAREARKRSQLIDKQIEADLGNRNRQCVILTNGSNASMSLLMDRFMAKSTGYSTHGTSGMEPTSRAMYINTIRRQVLIELKEMVSAAIWYAGYVWTEDELQHLTSVHEKIPSPKSQAGQEEALDVSVLQELIEPIEKLWASEQFREACKKHVGYRNGRLEAHNRIVMDAFRRVSSPNYMPAPADYHMFYLNDKRSLFRGTFDFNALSVTWIDFTRLTCCSPLLPRKRSIVLYDATAYVKIFDLAMYDLDENGSNAIKEELALLAAMAESKSYHPKMSIIAVFSNLAMFKEKLAKKPLSRKEFPDYMGEDGNEAQTLAFLVEKFKCQRGKRQMYVHVGEPEEPETTNFILGAIKDTKLNSVLDDAGVIRMGTK
ncbi:G-protein alpha subunit-domain-containing protein [Rhypophila decipiens]|uniref:G-protein alpha subunit-domain-containing protein n=1 Tax=Rhypophila decipiens TaxID=261697 RepID=A0AAN6Y135_9PEZI|nr:G-protein alpha subunit-domain-containing protein [Rhypophila decipiens]